MLKDVLNVAEKADMRNLLTVFVSLALVTYDKDVTLLENPFTWKLLLVPIVVFMAYTTTFAWRMGIHRLNSGLPENDLASWGPLVGCSLLAVAILFSFSYLATHPGGLSFALLGKPEFVRLCTLYLLALESIKIKRRG